MIMDLRLGVEIGKMSQPQSSSKFFLKTFLFTSRGQLLSGVTIKSFSGLYVIDWIDLKEHYIVWSSGENRI